MSGLKTKLKIGKKGVAVNALIGLFIAVMIGVAITVTVVSQQVTYSTSTYSAGNTTANATNADNTTWQITMVHGLPTGSEWTVLNDANLHVYNSSDCSTTEFTRNTDYVLLNNGTQTVTMNFTDAGQGKIGNVHLCTTYNYRHGQYIDSSTARSLVGLFTVLVGVSLLAILAGSV